MKTIVLILPKRLEMDEATRVDNDAMIEDVKNREPNLPSSMSNLRLKKYVTHDLRVC